MKGSLLILAFFVAGIFFGVNGLIPQEVAQSQASTYALYALLFFAGIAIGSDSDMIRKFRELDPRVLALPLLSIAGTLIACMIVGFLMPHRSTPDCMAVGSGMAYYSLSSIMVTELKGAELGTITLIANVIRELAVLLCTPLMVKGFGPLAPIACGGANTMDTTLPIIMKYTGHKSAVICIYHGLVVTILVPFIVSFFCAI